MTYMQKKNPNAKVAVNSKNKDETTNEDLWREFQSGIVFLYKVMSRTSDVWFAI